MITNTPVKTEMSVGAMLEILSNLERHIKQTRRDVKTMKFSIVQGADEALAATKHENMADIINTAGGILPTL